MTCSVLSDIDGPFSILEHPLGSDSNGSEMELDELQLPISMAQGGYEESEEKQHQLLDEHHEEDELYIVENEANVRVEIPVNAAAEILGNFLGASVGVCVPGLDVITSVDSAESYKLLQEYTRNTDSMGNAPTLLVYEG